MRLFSHCTVGISCNLDSALWRLNLFGLINIWNVLCSWFQLQFLKSWQKNHWKKYPLNSSIDRDPQKGIGNLETPNLCTADKKPESGVHGCRQVEKGTWPVHSKRLRTPGEGYILEELTDCTGCLPFSSWNDHSKKPLQTSKHGGEVLSMEE